MNVIKPECELFGDSFYPSKLLKLLPQTKMRLVTEPGEIILKGRHKNLPSPYGACRIFTPENIEIGKRIEWMADYIGSNLEIFKSVGASEITPWIYWTGQQGNMEFSPVELKKLSDLGLGVCVDYIQKENNE